MNWLRCRIGFFLSHVFDDGSEQTIGFASCTLAPAERNILSWKKAFIAIVFRVK